LSNSLNHKGGYPFPLKQNSKMQRFLDKVGLNEITIESLQSALDERESYNGPISFACDSGTIEQFSAAVQLMSTSTQGLDISTLKKITIYLNCLIVVGKDTNSNISIFC
jgi:uncharacterized protein YpuA (DUF1002 family)